MGGNYAPLEKFNKYMMGGVIIFVLCTVATTWDVLMAITLSFFCQCPSVTLFGRLNRVWINIITVPMYIIANLAGVAIYLIVRCDASVHSTPTNKVTQAPSCNTETTPL